MPGEDARETGNVAVAAIEGFESGAGRRIDGTTALPS